MGKDRRGKMKSMHSIHTSDISPKRNAWKIFLFVFLTSIVFILLLWISAFYRTPVALTPDEVLLEAVLIDVEDMPDSWRVADTDIEQHDVPDGIGKGISFEHFRNRPWINIRGDVYVYRDDNAAKQGYRTQRERFSRFELQGWEILPQLEFAYHADEIQLSCTEGYIDQEHHFVCETVGRYGRVVIRVGGNIFDDRWLTAEQFRQVLVTADQKAEQSRAKQ